MDSDIEAVRVKAIEMAEAWHMRGLSEYREEITRIAAVVHEQNATAAFYAALSRLAARLTQTGAKDAARVLWKTIKPSDAAQRMRSKLLFVEPADGEWPDFAVMLVDVAIETGLRARLAPVDVAEFEGHTPEPWQFEASQEWGYTTLWNPTTRDEIITTGGYNDGDEPITWMGGALTDADKALILAAPRLLRELTEARVWIAALEKALQNIAQQNLTEEMSGVAFKHADFEAAYETMIDTARAALSVKTTEEPST